MILGSIASFLPIIIGSITVSSSIISGLIASFIISGSIADFLSFSDLIASFLLSFRV